MPGKKSTGLHLNQILLRVRNIPRSKEFYARKLGFKVQYDYGEYVALLTPNKIQIGLHSSNERKYRNTNPGAVGIEFDVNNVDQWYERLRKKGVKFSKRPHDQPWGEREALFKDPDGYNLAISGPSKSR